MESFETNEGLRLDGDELVVFEDDDAGDGQVEERPVPNGLDLGDRFVSVIEVVVVFMISVQLYKREKWGRHEKSPNERSPNENSPNEESPTVQPGTLAACCKPSSGAGVVWMS